MTDQIIPIDKIKNEAIAAAERGFGPGECPYLPGTDAERTWKDAFYIRVSQLMTVGAV